MLLDAITRALAVAAESPLLGKVIIVGATGVALAAFACGTLPWTHQQPDNLKWTAVGIDLLKAVDVVGVYEGAFRSPKVGETMTPAQLDIFFQFNIFTDQILDRGLATGRMTPRRFGIGGLIFDFLFLSPNILGAITSLALGSFALGSFGAIQYSRAPSLVAVHLFGYLYVLAHTALVLFAHLGMLNDAKKVEAYNKRPEGPKPFFYILWGEQAAGDGPRGAHPFDRHTWPPLVYIPPRGIPYYMKGYILTDVPSLALLAIGSPNAYLSIWACYLCAGLTDHLLLFGSHFSDRIKTVLPIRGINMLQCARCHTPPAPHAANATRRQRHSARAARSPQSHAGSTPFRSRPCGLRTLTLRTMDPDLADTPCGLWTLTLRTHLADYGP